MDEPRRRDLLGTIAGVGTVVGISGCLGVLNGDGGADATTTDGSTDTTTTGSTDTTTTGSTDATTGRTPTATGTVTGGEPPAFRDFAAWTPPSAAFETPRLSVGYVDASAIDDHADRFPQSTTATLRRFVAGHAVTVGLDGESVVHDLQIAPAYTDEEAGVVRSTRVHVLLGDFEASSVVESDALSEFEEAESYGGYTFYTASNAAVAVRDGAAVRARDLRVSAHESIRAVINARAGDRETLLDAEADAELAMEGLASAHYVSGRTDPYASATPPDVYEGTVALARSFTFEGATTTLEQRIVFERSPQIDVEAIRTATSEDPGGLATYDYSIRKEGRVVVVEGTTPTEQFDLLSEGTP